MPSVGLFRLYLLRGMYLLLVVGLGLTMWPEIISPSETSAGEYSVIVSLLGALGLLSLLGLRYPLQMLPLLVFELVWKVIWLLAFAFRMWLGPGLDDYATETAFACLMGVVLVPVVMPWRYFVDHYIRAPGERWRAK